MFMFESSEQDYLLTITVSGSWKTQKASSYANSLHKVELLETFHPSFCTQASSSHPTTALHADNQILNVVRGQRREDKAMKFCPFLLSRTGILNVVISNKCEIGSFINQRPGHWITNDS